MNANVASEPVGRRLDALAEQLAWLVERQHRQEELFAEMTPIVREVIATATTRLDEMEKRGWFGFGRELARVGERILDHYTAEDVRALGDAVVTILDTVRALTRPEVLAIIGEASQGLRHADEVEPLGLVGMVRASRHDEVQKGMAVLMDLLRHVGRAASVTSTERSPADDKKARLAEALGPRRGRKVLGTERTAVKRLPAPAAAAAARPAAPPACHVPTEKLAEVATVIDGVGFTADGHLADPSAWTRTLAESIAAVQGIALTPGHWKVIEAARDDFEKAKLAANIRRLTQISGLSTRDIYALFPKAPGRTIARIAGTPKPAGCI
jgi:TusE/DsrC/DsvC family sulfur relay protein